VIPERGAPGNRPGSGRDAGPAERPVASLALAPTYGAAEVIIHASKKSLATALTVAAMVGFASPTSGQEADPSEPIALTVEEAVVRALSTNEETRIARADVDRTEGAVREAFARALPSIDGSYQLTRNLQSPVLFFNDEAGNTTQIQLGGDNDHTFGLSLRQTLFDKSLGAAIEAAEHGSAASEAAYERALSNVAFRARQAYYEALRDRARVRVRESALDLAETRLGQVRQHHEVGIASDFDLLTARVGVENERPALIQARNALRLSLNSLKRVVGVPLDAPVELVDTLAYQPVVIGLEEATERAARSRGDLVSQRRTVQLQEEIVEVERAATFPSFELQLDLTRRASSDDFIPDDRDFSQTATAGLRIEIPVFDGRSGDGRTLQARADVVAARERLRALERDVELEVLDAWQSLEAAGESVEASRAALEQAQRAYDIALVRFRNGLSTQLELDEAEQDLIVAESNLADTLYLHLLARAQLRNAMGER